MKTEKRRFARSSALALLGAVSTAAGCTSLLGIGGDFSVQGSGGAGASTSSSGAGASGATGGGGASSTGGGTASGGGGAASLPITGHQTKIQVGTTGILNQSPVDFTQPGHVIQALTVDSAGMNWTTFEAVINSLHKNEFTIDGVPAGRYLLNVDGNFIWMDARDNIDLDEYSAVRVNAIPLQHNPRAHFVLGNMTAWGDNDVWELFAPKSGAYSFLQGDDISLLGVSPGDVSVDGTVRWRSVVFNPRNFINPGDELALFHLGSVGANDYLTVVDYVDPVAVDMVDDDTATFDVDATYGQVVQDQGFDLNADLDAFGATVPAFNAAATNGVFSLDYIVSPAKLGVAGIVSAGADLILFHQAPTGALHKHFDFGSPFGGWDPAANLSVVADLDVAYPNNAATTMSGIPILNCFYPADDPVFSSGNVKPGLTSVTSPKLDGHPFSSVDHPVVSVNPMVSWSPPTTGTPTEWVFIAYPIADDGGGGTIVQYNLATSFIATGNTSKARFPQGALSPSTYYVIDISAYACPGCDTNKSPIRNGFPACSADVMSNVFKTADP